MIHIGAQHRISAPAVTEPRYYSEERTCGYFAEQFTEISTAAFGFADFQIDVKSGQSTKLG